MALRLFGARETFGARLDIALFRSTVPHRKAIDAIVNSFLSKSLHTSVKMCLGDVEVAPKLRFAKLTEHATVPSKGSESAAGFDLSR